MPMKILDIMSSNVETIGPYESAEQAWQRMVSAKIHHLVVMENREVVGVISQRDLGGRKGEAIRRNLQVRDLMTADPIIAQPEMTLKEAMNELRGYSIGCIPVLQNREKLVGIVTLTDLLERIGRGLERGALRVERRCEFGRPIYRRPGHPPIS